jgi:hypothetical protein
MRREWYGMVSGQQLQQIVCVPAEQLGCFPGCSSKDCMQERACQSSGHNDMSSAQLLAAQERCTLPLHGTSAIAAVHQHASGGAQGLCAYPWLSFCMTNSMHDVITHCSRC